MFVIQHYRRADDDINTEIVFREAPMTCCRAINSDNGQEKQFERLRGGGRLTRQTAVPNRTKDKEANFETPLPLSLKYAVNDTSS